MLRVIKKIPYGKESEPWDLAEWPTCPDCGVREGEFHRPNCDVEECATCGDQLLTCGHKDKP